MASKTSDALLLLVETYSSETEGDEEDDSVPEKVHQKQKEKLPVPEDIQGMFADKSETDSSNNSVDHEGRVRTFAHVRGNWASFVFIPFKSTNSSIAQMIAIVHSSLEEFPDQVKLVINEEFHLSLSKTVVLHHHWIEPFIQSLKTSFKLRKRFDVIFTEFKVYMNEEKTRTFIGMNVFPSEMLVNLIRDCDISLSEYGLEKYYENASFHVSIAWCVGNQERWLSSQLLPIINSKWSQVLDSDSSLQVSSVQHIELKTGNKVYQFLLDET